MPDIIEKTKELGLAQGSYVVVGGGALVALGILEWDEDIDICVAPHVFEALKAQGWSQQRWQDKLVLKHGVYDVGVGFGDWSLEELLEDALWVEKVAFINLLKLRTWKTQMGRPKDQLHVALIDQYLDKNIKR